MYQVINILIETIWRVFLDFFHPFSWKQFSLLQMKISWPIYLKFFYLFNVLSLGNWQWVRRKEKQCWIFFPGVSVLPQDRGRKMFCVESLILRCYYPYLIIEILLSMSAKLNFIISLSYYSDQVCCKENRLCQWLGPKLVLCREGARICNLSVSPCRHS